MGAAGKSAREKKWQMMGSGVSEEALWKAAPWLPSRGKPPADPCPRSSKAYNETYLRPRPERPSFSHPLPSPPVTPTTSGFGPGTAPATQANPSAASISCSMGSSCDTTTAFFVSRSTATVLCAAPTTAAALGLSKTEASFASLLWLLALSPP